LQHPRPPPPHTTLNVLSARDGATPRIRGAAVPIALELRGVEMGSKNYGQRQMR